MDRDDHQASTGARKIARTTGRLLRRHWVLALLLALGAVLRVLVLIGYDPGFWYVGDSGTYLGLAYVHQPSVSRPYGYSLFLDLLLGLHSIRAIIVIQHVMGLALAALGYAFLQRRGVSRLVATLAVTPLLFDARTVALEHYLLAETLFTVLIVVGMVALCWRPSPGWVAVLAAAATFGFAAVTRSIGMMALAVPLLYLLLRRVSWPKTVVFASIIGVVLGGYMVWYHGNTGEYAITSYSGRFLWSRTTTFVDCRKLDLTPLERPLCPAEPLGARLYPDVYLWTKAPYGITKGKRYNQAYGSFARKAIMAQPGDYALTVLTDTWQMVRPGPYPAERISCLAANWSFVGPGEQTCQAFMATEDPRTPRHAEALGQHDHPLMTPLHAYSDVATVPGTLIALCFLLAIALACFRPRSSSWREHLDPLTWTGLAFGMIVGSVATSAVDVRYTAPSLPLAVIGAALAWRRFQAARSTAPADPAAPIGPVQLAPAAADGPVQLAPPAADGPVQLAPAAADGASRP
jgi:hypothetical protein